MMAPHAGYCLRTADKIVAASDRHDTPLDALPKAATAINDPAKPQTPCSEQTVTQIFSTPAAEHHPSSAR
jgi:hypothetical protein